MSNTLLRQWSMLKRIPRAPAKIDTRTLMDHLEQEGFSISQRSIQRDLKMLTGIFPDLQSDGNRDVAGWSWKHGSQVNDFPAIDPPMALTFKLAESFLSSLIPPSVMDLLHPYFDISDKVLDSLDKKGFSNWSEKVAILPRTQPLIPAKVDSDIMRIIYEALLQQKKFRGRYKPREGDEAEYDFNPYGLVYRDSVIYLVGSIWIYENPRHYALHRFKKCDLMDEKFNLPEDFDLQEYIDSGEFEYVVGSGKDIKLTAIFSAEAAYHLYETPLCEDQKLTKKRDGRIQLTATVKDSQQLRWWLLGFGANVEIVKPLKLRSEFLLQAKEMAYLYKEIHSCG